MQLNRYWSNLGLKRRFLGFFLLASVLPILLFSGLFFHQTRHILNQRNNELLQAGLLLSQEMLLDQLDQLGLMANQLAAFSLSEKYDQALQQGRVQPLEELLNRYLAARNIDLLILQNAQGEPVALASPNLSLLGSGHREPYSRQFESLLKAARGGHGNMVTSIEALSSHANMPDTLWLLSATPVFSSRNHAMTGVLLLGRNMRDVNRHGDFSRLPQDLSLRILGMQAGTVKTLLNTGDIPAGSRPAAINRPFDESVAGVSYRSLARPIANLRGNPVGYLVVSTPQQSLDALINHNTIYIAVYLVVGILLVTVMGAWFNRTFIEPMNNLSRVADDVAAGDLDARVPMGIPYEEMNRTLSNFNRMLDELQEKEALRKTFVSTLTHDLRTPLIAQKRVVDFFETRIKSELDPQSANLLGGLATSNDHLLEMVNKLLETYQMEAGQMTLSPVHIALHTLVDTCFTELSQMAHGKQIELANTVPADYQIMADPAQFKRVLLNLLGNSIENIADRDRIEIRAEKQDGRHRIEVADNGPGIEPELLPHLFERYPGQYGRRQKIGSGLGLFICKTIVEKHGGTIRVCGESGQRSGTRFIIELPERVSPESRKE